jgi:DNA/RNA endonuclease G (NUC1)
MINQAPQNTKTNSGSWQTLEKRITTFAAIEEDEIAVMTGVSESTYDYKGITVPNYFWKLVCWREMGLPLVACFIHDNSKDTIEPVTTAEPTTPCTGLEFQNIKNNNKLNTMEVEWGQIAFSLDQPWVAGCGFALALSDF